MRSLSDFVIDHQMLFIGGPGVVQWIQIINKHVSCAMLQQNPPFLS